MDSLVEDALEEAEQETTESSQPDSSAPNRSPVSTTPRHPDDHSGNMTDEELADVVKQLETNITVVGCGGAGCNTIDRMVKDGVDGADLVAINTDAQHLQQIESEQKILIGRQRTGGRGAGAVPQVGEESALENQNDIIDAIDGSDMVFITAGMGGGTGTGSAPVVAEAAQEAGALTISVVTMPFEAEGERRRENADGGIARLQKVSDTLIVVPNDRLLDFAPDLPLSKAFKISDRVLVRSVKGITELITQPGMVNLDFADVRTIMESGGVAMIGMDEASGAKRSRDSINGALSSPMLDVDISSATGVLVNVTGGSDMTIEEAEGVVEQIHDKVGNNARIIWGASINNDLGDSIQTMLVVTGVDSPQMYSRDGVSSAAFDESDDETGDIDFIE